MKRTPLSWLDRFAGTPILVVGDLMVEAVSAFAADVRSHRYPAPEHMYGMSADELARFKEKSLSSRA